MTQVLNKHAPLISRRCRSRRLKSSGCVRGHTEKKTELRPTKHDISQSVKPMITLFITQKRSIIGN